MISRIITTISRTTLALGFTFLLTTQFSFSQNKVCESGSDDILVDLNAIGKCAINKFKKSESKEYVKIATRNRYVRKKRNSYVTNLKKNLKTVTPIKKTKELTKNTDVKIVRPEIALVKDFMRFDKVTNIPVFITCSDTVTDKQSCVKETLVATILENLVYPFDAAASGIEAVVWVRFIIDKEGYIKNITTQAPENGKLLEVEAKRLISLLPKFLPGTHNDSYVNVEYFLPIDFQLDK